MSDECTVNEEYSNVTNTLTVATVCNKVLCCSMCVANNLNLKYAYINVSIDFSEISNAVLIGQCHCDPLAQDTKKGLADRIKLQHEARLPDSENPSSRTLNKHWGVSRAIAGQKVIWMCSHAWSPSEQLPVWRRQACDAQHRTRNLGLFNRHVQHFAECYCADWYWPPVDWTSGSDTCEIEKRETLKREHWGAGFSSVSLIGEFGGVQILSESGSIVEALGINEKSFSHSKVPPV